MRNYLSAILFIGVIGLPAGLFVGQSMIGKGHPFIGRTVDKPDWLERSKNEVEVFFFGYTECAFICPQSLFKLGDVLDSVLTEHTDIRVGAHFLDINAKTQIHRANQYSQAFSENITGHNIPFEELEILKKEFGLSILESKDENNEIFHTDHFFVLKREDDKWIIKHVLDNNSSPAIIAESILTTAE